MLNFSQIFGLETFHFSETAVAWICTFAQLQPVLLACILSCHRLLLVITQLILLSTNAEKTKANKCQCTVSLVRLHRGSANGTKKTVKERICGTAGF